MKTNKNNKIKTIIYWCLVQFSEGIGLHARHSLKAAVIETEY